MKSNQMSDFSVFAWLLCRSNYPIWFPRILPSVQACVTVPTPKADTLYWWLTIAVSDGVDKKPSLPGFTTGKAFRGDVVDPVFLVAVSGRDAWMQPYLHARFAAHFVERPLPKFR